MPSGHATTLAAALASAVLLLIAYTRIIRPRTFVVLAFAAGIAGSALLLWVPTPPGFDPNASASSWRQRTHRVCAATGGRAHGHFWYLVALCGWIPAHPTAGIGGTEVLALRCDLLIHVWALLS